MKKFLFFALFIGFLSCSEDEVSPSILRYEVITSSGLWNGEFNNENGERISAEPFNLSSGWTYAFTPTTLPFEMYVYATSETEIIDNKDKSADVVINFYKENELISSDTNTWARGVTSLWLVVE